MKKIKVPIDEGTQNVVSTFVGARENPTRDCSVYGVSVSLLCKVSSNGRETASIRAFFSLSSFPSKTDYHPGNLVNTSA